MVQGPEPRRSLWIGVRKEAIFSSEDLWISILIPPNEEISSSPHGQMAALLEAAGGKDWFSSKIKLKYVSGNSKHSNAPI